MEKIFTSIGLISIFCGICMLAASIISVKHILLLLNKRSLRIKWYILAVLICFFIIGYLVYAVIIWNRQMEFVDLIVPMVFFFGAIFVMIVNELSFKTAKDLQRIDILEKENITDSLMQIYNRRYFHTRLDQEIKRSERYKHHLSLLMLDIDHFKNINDVHGHQIGDEVLVGIAFILKLNVRTIDVIARYGGEEIVVILPETDKKGAFTTAEKIRKGIENHSFDPTSGEKFSVTVSFGVSSLEMIKDKAVDKSKRIIKLADDALYKAKNEGRNRVFLYE